VKRRAGKRRGGRDRFSPQPHSSSSTGLTPVIQRLYLFLQGETNDVDGPVKPGHDDERERQPILNYLDELVGWAGKGDDRAGGEGDGPARG